MERIPIKLQRLELSEFISQIRGVFEGNIKYKKDLKLINVRGCNGSGKSSIPLSMLAQDRGSFILTVKGKDKATVFPSFNFVALGRYKSKTGGLDGMKNNQETSELLEMLWETPFNILMEGVISSTIFSTYLDLFKMYEKRDDPCRNIGIFNLLPPFDICLKRIKKRSPDKFESIKTEQIEGKWRTVERNADKFRAEGLKSWNADNSTVELSETIEWFFKEIADNM